VDKLLKTAFITVFDNASMRFCRSATPCWH